MVQSSKCQSFLKIADIEYERDQTWIMALFFEQQCFYLCCNTIYQHIFSIFVDKIGAKIFSTLVTIMFNPFIFLFF